MAKEPQKKRSGKYDPKLAINGSFKDVFKVVKKNKEEKQVKQEKTTQKP